ncbi:MAG: hypothetical protein A3F12_02010 [Gammaproteobacteria bacterium RIFCSPHIGHO2_12_FULL_38_14]|nr:MAG: hypothetical protein A3F12_02010 [Gammaproteobacteria bacterium RIFCSPHIGHO2_12_FULL_38_14]
MITTRRWAAQDAKAHFSELLSNTEKEGPQFISVRGNPRAVVISIEEYVALTTPAKTLVDFFKQSPLRGMSLKFKRDKKEI